MRQSFTVSVKLPGANDCLWKHWRTFRNIKQAAQREIGVAIRRAKLKPMQYARISFEWREPDQKRDFDNIMFAQKFVLDALVASEILQDDGWAYVTEIRHVVVMNPALPGVHVTLEER